MGPGIWVQNGCCYIPLGKSPTTWVHEVGALWGAPHLGESLLQQCHPHRVMASEYSGPLLGMECGEALWSSRGFRTEELK